MRSVPIGRRNEYFIKASIELFCWILKFDTVNIVSIDLLEETLNVQLVCNNIFSFMAYLYNYYPYLYCYECRYAFNIKWNTCEHVQEYFC